MGRQKQGKYGAQRTRSVVAHERDMTVPDMPYKETVVSKSSRLSIPSANRVVTVECAPSLQVQRTQSRHTHTANAVTPKENITRLVNNHDNGLDFRERS